ncbi:YjcZ family sporulation protein [Ureibacillus composti]|nr:YjcZ family sporulation protein [Ureibacillus composti]
MSNNNSVGGSYDYDRYDNNNNGFALLVVLFILLIIVGTAFMNYYY